MAGPEVIVPVVLLLSALIVWGAIQIAKLDKLRRDGFNIIVSRFPILSMIQAVALLTGASVLPLMRISGLEYGDNPECPRTILLDQVITSFSAPCTICRLYLLIFTSRLQKQMSLHARINKEETDRHRDEEHSMSESRLDGFILNNQFLKRGRFISFQLFVLLLLFFTTPLLGLITCANTTKVQPILMVLVVIYIIILLGFLFKTEERMGVKTELKMNIALVILKLVVRILGEKLGMAPPFAVYEILSVLLSVAIFCVVIIYPQWLVRKQLAKLDKFSGHIDVETFLQDTKLGAKFLQDYLEMEFCVENLVFWKDVQLHKQTPSVRSAYKMYERYIRNLAPLQVNIPGKVRTQVRTAVAEICKENPRYNRRFSNLQLSVKNKKKFVAVAGSDTATIRVTPSHDISGRESRQSDSNPEIPTVSSINIVGIFDRAERCVMELILNGPWIRFVVSEDFEKWKRAEADSPHHV